MLVVDASVVVRALGSAEAFVPLAGHDLVGPPLLWSEARSAIREATWRRELSVERGRELAERLETAPVERRAEPRLGAEAWRIAEALGWAKTYDAEYVALARLLACRLVTLDGRLRRGADRLGGVVVTPAEL